MRISIDGNWLFMTDPENRGTDERWFAETTDRSSWREVRIPGSWEDYPEMSRYDGLGWFARTVEITDTGKPLSLFFGGIDDDATIWINGIVVGSHEGHAEPFAVNAGDASRPGLNSIVVRVHDHGGGGGIYGHVTLTRTDEVATLLRGELYGTPARESAEWVRKAVIYEVYLRSFSPEGTFMGLEERLPELRELGATVLWLMPVHPVGHMKRKGSLGSPYSIADYYSVNPEFGSLDDFRSLVESTHRHGMKIIIDLVANHTAWDNRLMQTNPDWYTTDSAGRVVPPNSDWTDVADLDYSHSEMREWMMEMMEYWVREIGIDGFRCDVAEMVPTDFWEEARRRLDAIKPVMMLSEGSLPEHHRSAFDITYSWGVYNAMTPLLNGTKPPTFLNSILESEENRFPRGSLRMRFNTNHDKNAWDEPAVLKFGMEGLRLTTVLVHTMPGIPLIYTGEEVANDRRLDLFEKIEVDWERKNGMRELIGRLGKIRRRNPALTDGSFEYVATSSPELLYSFIRRAGDSFVLVVVNFSGDSVRGRLSVPHESIGSNTVIRLADLFSGEMIEVPGAGTDLDLGVIGGHEARVYHTADK